MRTILWLFVSAVAIPTAGQAQESATLDKRVTTILARMASRDLATREAAFGDILDVMMEGVQRNSNSGYSGVLASFFARHRDQADRVTLALIDLLKAENDTFIVDEIPPGQGPYTNDDMEHYAQIIEVVASLKDERAIPALVGALTTGGIATEGVLQYGQEALGPLLSQVNSPNRFVRSSVVEVAVTILKKKNDAASRAQISAIVVAALKDPDYLVRFCALGVIEGLDDWAQFVPALQEIAEHDPHVIQEPGQDARYSLRIRAKELLQRIANH